MSYVLKRTDGKGGFVTPPGQSSSYTPVLQRARTWPSREAAQGAACGNERAFSLEEAMEYGNRR